MATPFYRVSGYMTPADALMGRRATRGMIARYWLARLARRTY